jgi:hypothetical protein
MMVFKISHNGETVTVTLPHSPIGPIEASSDISLEEAIGRIMVVLANVDSNPTVIIEEKK